MPPLRIKPETSGGSHIRFLQPPIAVGHITACPTTLRKIFLLNREIQKHTSRQRHHINTSCKKYVHDELHQKIEKTIDSLKS